MSVLEFATKPPVQSSIHFVSPPYHPGEIAVQKRLGVREQARDLEGMYRDAVKPAVAEFLAQHQFAVLASADSDGNLWASPLAGPAGILTADERCVAIQRHLLDPPLDIALVDGSFAALLVIDFERRLRLRMNGTIDRSAGVPPAGAQASAAALNLRVAQFYGNCQKYIQRRVLANVGGTGCPQHVQTETALSEVHRSLISRSDTFFIATSHPESGADASHRGGRRGFVIVKDDHTLTWPDYRGNNMFNTLGNLEEDTRAGVLFIDFDSGASLQLTGRATAQFDDPSNFTPTGRSVTFEITGIRELPPSPYLRYSLIEPFPYNPPVTLSPTP